MGGIPSVTTRPMTAAERYYTYLDFVTPMNLLLVAELDRFLPVDEVAEGWARFSALRALTRLVVRPDLTLDLVASAAGEFAGLELPSADWNGELSRESLQPFGFDGSMRCRYYGSPDEGRSRIVFVCHHALVDGRVGVAALQRFVRGLAGQPVPSQPGLTIPAEPVSYPWQSDRRQFRELLGELARANAAAGAVQPTDWPAPDGARRPRFFSFSIEGAEADALLAGARSHSTRAYPAMAAAWLTTAGRRLTRSDEPTLQLATPVDRGAATPDPEAPTAPVVSVIAKRYLVDPASPWELARRVRAGLETAIARGEGELFFELTRANAITDLDVGVAAVRQALATAAPTVSVTNLGIIDPGSDPEWLRSMCGYLAPGPHQVIFVSGLGYRGRLVHSAATDDSQLAPSLAASLVDGYLARVREMSAEAAAAR